MATKMGANEFCSLICMYELCVNLWFQDSLDMAPSHSFYKNKHMYILSTKNPR